MLTTTQKEATPEIALPTELPYSRGETARKLIRAVEEASNVRIEWPLSSRDVFALMKIIGYRADINVLNYCLQRKRYFTAPAKEGNHYRWSMQNVIDFCDTLESMRRWLPMHPVHVHKLRPDEKRQHLMEANKSKALFQAYLEMHRNELINTLAATDEAEERDLLAAALKQLLNTQGHFKGTETGPSPNPENN